MTIKVKSNKCQKGLRTKEYEESGVYKGDYRIYKRRPSLLECKEHDKSHTSTGITLYVLLWEEI